MFWAASLRVYWVPGQVSDNHFAAFSCHFSHLESGRGLTRAQLVLEVGGGTWHACDPPWKAVTDTFWSFECYNVLCLKISEAWMWLWGAPKQVPAPISEMGTEPFTSACQSARLYEVRCWKVGTESLNSNIYIFKYNLTFHFEII